MPRPVLLLDVDGVLNPFAAATCPRSRRTWATGRPAGRLGRRRDHAGGPRLGRRPGGRAALLVPIDPAVGLTRDTVEELERWADDPHRAEGP